jgi:hypothetical protein
VDLGREGREKSRRGGGVREKGVKVKYRKIDNFVSD